MEVNTQKLKHSLKELFLKCKSEQSLIKDWLKRLCELSSEDIDQIIDFVTNKVTNPDFTEIIGFHFQDFLHLIVTKLLSKNDLHDHREKCIALSCLLKYNSDILKYAYNYISTNTEPYKLPEQSDGRPLKKKHRKFIEKNDLDVVKCCFEFLKADLIFFKNVWDWADFIDLFWNKGSNLQKLYTNQILALLTNMTDLQLNILNKDIPIDLQIENKVFENILPEQEIPITSDPVKLQWNFKSNVVTNIEGVFLPIFDPDNYQFFNNFNGNSESIVKVDSTKVNLRSLALGVSSGKAICLNGPVGSGKTTLVEYLARKTGRVAPKLQELIKSKVGSNNDQNPKLNKKAKKKNRNNMLVIAPIQNSIIDIDEIENLEKIVPTNGFLRIQLGDQTDSKMLLGQYRCTDVPGEFIWQPGVLTQAVLNGYWLLLEDLDTATQDVCTVLTNLLENNYLSVPGFRDCIKIEPGFQLFLTLRTQKSSNSSHSVYSLLEKYLYSINISPLSRHELSTIICENYPKLTTVALRIVDVYLQFSSGDHSLINNGGNNENMEKYTVLPYEKTINSKLPISGRLVSTRDLLKLCRRSDPTFNVTSSECAYFVFENAVDLFCSYLPNGEIKTDLIVSIGSKLGIIESRCKSLSQDYKPVVQLTNEFIKIGRSQILKRQIKENVSFMEKRKQVDEDFEIESVQKKRKLTNNRSSMEMQFSSNKKTPTFSFTRLASCILERITVGVAQNEPILLVGETGVGKTSSVQYLAHQTNHKLVVINMNNQSDVSDLLGGFKPVDLSYVMTPLRLEFEYLFKKTFNTQKNEKFLNNISVCFNSKMFDILIKLMLNIIEKFFKTFKMDTTKIIKLREKWSILKVKLLKLDSQLKNSINISFAFIPGSLVNCIKNGEWILLDEINLASTETLECLSTILEPDGSIVLLEKGDFVPVRRHPDFRIFACMNPNTDVGKKDLPVGIRNRFTEFFVDELKSESDLIILITDYLKNTGIIQTKVMNVVKLYKNLRILAQLELNDGLGNRPVYSLRTLCRALTICVKNLCGSTERNLYESFCLSFLTQLDSESHKRVLLMIQKALLTDTKTVLSHAIPKPKDGVQLNFEGYWIKQGPKEIIECENYILTDSVRMNLKDLARIVSIGKLPVLLQGPTSAGKTSLIEFVAKKSGNYCLRINNHEHTDLQEYIGTYTADISGKLSFKEGVLVQAMRKGYWIILDELNLAPSDILEALNRVLDDNRELFIPETQTLIKAHPNFMLFATQNPPGLYGGRKTLSRAFKNRFIELHFAEIPKPELEIILEKRCLIPKSYALKMVKTMTELQMNRKSTTKNSFTLRDLFRWGNRYTFADKSLLDNNLYDWNQHLIDEGYLVLSAKVRQETEISMIEDALFNNFRKKISLENLFSLHENTSMVTRKLLLRIINSDDYKNIVWTYDMRRMAVLAGKSLDFDEPVLLIGPTGCGKTTICQVLADSSRHNLRILNCHMHTEGADFIGGLRPFRESNCLENGNTIMEKNGIEENKQKQLFEWSNGPLILSMQEGSFFLADEISLAEDSVLERLNCVLEPERTILLAEKGGVNDNFISETELLNNDDKSGEFLIKATDGFQFLATMNPGGDFGKKELSPALRNRFTEIWCRATDSKDELIKIAEQSLALGFGNNLKTIEKDGMKNIANIIINTVFTLKERADKFNCSIRDILAWVTYITSNAHISELSKPQSKKLSLVESLFYGLETIFLDSLEMLPYETYQEIENIRLYVLKYLEKNFQQLFSPEFSLNEFQEKKGSSIEIENNKFGISPFYMDVLPDSCNDNLDFMFSAPTTQNNLFRLLSALSLQKSILLEGPPGVGKTSLIENFAHAIGYEIVRINLCEHTDLADLFGTDLPADDKSLELCVVNEETTALNDNLNDLNLGSFVWRDGPLLAALKAKNTWILLDELNLAPQSVLEGLNAVLDHRGEVYIPELNKTFKLGNQTRIFAAQNPLRQGGGRKGLPQSFLNRFTKVYLSKLERADLLHVVNWKFGKFFDKLTINFVGDSLQTGDSYFKIKDNQIENLRFDIDERMVIFSEVLESGIAHMEFGYKGGPFEVNLRDILRWCDLLSHPETGFIFNTKEINLEKNRQEFVLVLFEKMKLVYYQRMRTETDKIFIRNVFSRTFYVDADDLDIRSKEIGFFWNNTQTYLSDIILLKDQCMSGDTTKTKKLSPLILSSQVETLKNLTECVIMEKPVILCGPTDSGKTKSVDLLCSITNINCNVDTIDDSVTGSFQQIDFNRHLEEVSHIIESILFSTIRTLSLGSDSNWIRASIIKLLGSWERYIGVTDQSESTNNQSIMSDELIVFRKRLSCLNDVILILESLSTELKSVKQIMTTLGTIVKSAKSLNTGGHFEWVDSNIVKSIKFGQYICLEHVNLCSSAILDRLNPVLEPNGSLLISEKGVTIDNKAEIITKHKNFRTFLTLDPKNGEISRAMRNRCIELSLNKEMYTENDLRQLIFNIGIKKMCLIKLILSIHQKLCDVSEFSVFGVSHLLKFSFLTVQNIKMFVNDLSAVKMSAIEVYVLSSNADLLGFGLIFFRTKLKDIIENELIVYKKYDNIFNYENIILKADQLSQLKLIQLQAEPFLTLMKCFLNSDIDISQTMTNLSTNFEDLTITRNRNLLEYLLYLLYEISSYDDVTERNIYIKKMLNSLNNDDNSSKQIIHLLELNEKFLNDVKAFKTNTSDLPWNSKLFPRIRDYKKKKINVTNQLQLSSLILSRLVHKNTQIDISTKLSQIDAITYSKAVQQKIIQDSENNEFLNLLNQCVSGFENYLNEILKKYIKTINLDTTIELNLSLFWNSRLFQNARKKLFINKKLNESLIDSLILHFKWMEKYCFKLIKKMTENNTLIIDSSTTTLVNYEKVLQKLTNFMLNNKHPLSLIRRTYVKNFTNFLPFYNQNQIDYHNLNNKFLQMFNLYSNYTHLEYDEFLKRTSNLIKSEYVDCKMILLDCSKVIDELSWVESIIKYFNSINLSSEFLDDVKIFTDSIEKDDTSEDLLKLEDVEEKLEKVSKILDEYDNGTDGNNEMRDHLINNKSIIEILPLLEYFAVKGLHFLQSENKYQHKINNDFYLGISSIDHRILKTIQLISTQKYKSCDQLWKSICSKFEKISNERQHFLQVVLKTFSEFNRNYSTLTRNIRKDVQNFEINCLTIKNDICYNLNKIDNYNEIINNEPIVSIKSPVLTNMGLSLIFNTNGEFRSTGLGELDIWKSTLKSLSQVIWNNQNVLTQNFNFEYVGLQNIIISSRKLIVETDCLKDMIKVQDNIDDTPMFNISFDELIIKLRLVTNEATATLQSQPDADTDYQIRNNQLCFSSILSSLLGSIELNLLTYMPLLDPVEKNRLKKLYNDEDCEHLEKLMDSYNFMRIIMNYQLLGEEIVDCYVKKLFELQQKKEKYSKKVALRPPVCSYKNLVTDINHFLQTCCDPKTLLTLITSIESCLKYEINLTNIDINIKKTLLHVRNVNDSINHINRWINNAQRFEFHTLSQYTSYYRDFLNPIEYSLSTLRYGLTELKHLLVKSRDSIRTMSNGISHNLNMKNGLFMIMSELIEFPSIKESNILIKTNDVKLTDSKINIYTIMDKLDSCEINYFQLVKSKLYDLQNSVTISTKVNEEIFIELELIINVWNKIWQKQEDNRIKKQIEEDSLVVTKTKCQAEDEEKIDIEEIERIFPNYTEEDFGDFIQNDTLEQVIKTKLPKPNEKQQTEIITESDYSLLCETFIYMMELYSRSYYYKPKKLDESLILNLDYVTPYEIRSKVFQKLLKQYRTILSSEIDEQFYNGFNFLIGISQQNYSALELTEQNVKAYNFYKDSNIPEIIMSMEVLKKIELRVLEELKLWPEHAVLIDIIKVIRKIYTLSVTSPVVRFSTGFQILRQKVDEWNSVAHSKNNLRELETQLAEYIQKWTRLELQFWRECLSQTSEKVRSKSYKYWFFIYNLVHEYLDELSTISCNLIDFTEVEKCFSENEPIIKLDDGLKKDKINTTQLTNVLKQFIESSNYGDFNLRMKILKSFECYIHYLKISNNKKKEQIISIIHNIHMYFSQFTNEINEAVQQMRTPIEKKLKDFVKIESYNRDISYISMKNNISKIHEKLHKFLKEFEIELTAKILPVFNYKSNLPNELNVDDEKGKNLRFEAKVKYYMIDVKNFLVPAKLNEKYSIPKEINLTKLTLLPKISKLFLTSRNIVKEAILHAEFPSLIYSLDTLLSEQIETCDYLSKLEVNRELERKKQVSQAKHILQQKRKTLADLYKRLQQLGISYRAGIMENELNSELTNLKIQPFCIKTMLYDVKYKKVDQHLLFINENLDLYYTKTIYKLKLLFNTLQTPNAEMGPQNLERMKGYSIDMFLLVQQQRKTISKSVKDLYELRKHIKDINDLSEVCSGELEDLSESNEKEKLNFQQTTKTIRHMNNSVNLIRNVFEQFHLLLKTVPEESNGQLSLLMVAEEFTKKSVKYEKIEKLTNDILDSTIKLQGVFSKYDDTIFYTMTFTRDYKNDYNLIIDKISKLKEIFLNENNEYLVSGKVFVKLLNMLDADDLRNKEEYYNITDLDDSCNDSYNNYDPEFENIIHSILITMQTIYKKYSILQTNLYDATKEGFKVPVAPVNKSSPEKIKDDTKNVESKKVKNNVDDDDDDEPESDNILENHLKKKICEDILADLNLLNVQKICKKIDSILNVIKVTNGSNSKLHLIQKLIGILPILEQYSLLVEYYLIQQFGANKVSTKMLSIMLTVFIELASKGFCVPPDLMQEAEGKMKNKEDKGDGFGLEDGTGETDVSDRIESEDQLDDAKKPGEHKKQKDEEDDDCKEEKGIDMSEDFDSKLQDIEKPEKDDSDDSDKSDEEEEDLDKQMGETEEGAEKLDDQIWGSDDEKEDEDEDNMNEDENDKGAGETKEGHNDLDTDKENKSGKEEEEQGLDAADQDAKKEKNKKQKDIDEMKEPEVDEDQLNPHHNELEEPPEAEDMDLGDLNVNDDNDVAETNEENPFDIDEMKEQMEGAENDEEENSGEDEVKKDETELDNGVDSSDEEPEFGTEKEEFNGDASENEEGEEDKTPEKDDEVPTQTPGEIPPEEEEMEKPDEAEEKKKSDDDFHEAKDKSSKEENVQAAPQTENKGTTDQVKVDQPDNDVKQDDQMDDQDTGEDKEGIGQAENNESKTGHQGVSDRKENKSNLEKDDPKNVEEKRKQGNTNEERTLSDFNQEKNKRLKTIEKLNEEQRREKDDEMDVEEDEAEEYQHVKEGKKSDKTTLDNATEEQSKKIQPEDVESEKEDELEENDELMDTDENIDDDEENEAADEIESEKTDQKSKKSTKNEEKMKEVFETEEKVDVEGDIVKSLTVPRGNDTSAHCSLDVHHDASQAEEPTVAETLEMRKMFEEERLVNKFIKPQQDDFEVWQQISNKMLPNARELCEQLRLILEPTKCTRLKGDYRTGRRINMRKIIPYIASQFRKDKIWLRRTKPAQRDYKITIAIDDSKSMHHNNSKTLTLEAISLVSQALSLLESGKLSIVSFGESPQLILNYSDQFDGPKLVKSLEFSQNKSQIAQLLDFIRIANIEEGTGGSDNGIFENLLLVLSDGRNIFSEGDRKVRNSVKLARLQRIFIVYVIIDNPDNKHSILDIRTPFFAADRKSLTMQSYMDTFPFPYYVIVRDLGQLPLVLSEAMRQWFELVNSEQ